MADEELKLKLVLDAQEARAELKKVRAEAGKPVKVSAPSNAQLDREHRQAEARLRKSVAQAQAGVGPGRYEYKQAQAYERQQRRLEAAGQAGVGPGRPEFKLQKEEQANAKKRQAAADQMQQRAKAGAKKMAQDEERDKKKALAQIPMAKAAKETDKAAKSLNAFDKVLMRAGGGGGGINRLLGALGGTGGGGAGVGGVVMAIQLLKAGAEKAADVMKRIYHYGREGAAMLNPRGEHTLQLHRNMFQMEVGRSMLGQQRAEANVAEKGTRAMEHFNQWLQSPQGGAAATATFGSAAGWQHNKNLRKHWFGMATLQDAFNQAPQAQAGFGPAQQFDDMASYHRAMTQSNLSMGVAERNEWRKTSLASLDFANRPQNDPNKWLADDDAVSRVVDAINNMGATLGGLWLRGIGG